MGLCTAVGFASKGYKVVISDHDPEKAALINNGTPPFYEPMLQSLLQNVVKNDYLTCVVESKEAVLKSEITFIAVGTPSKADGSIDLHFIKNSAMEIGTALKEKETYHLIVVKSTVVPGTTEKIVKPTIENHSAKKCGADFGLCMNPEFLREGSALYDALNPDRIVIGEYDQRSGDILETFYRNFYSEKTPALIRTNLPTAELIKYANNAFLATKISFINQIANICERIPGADVTVVAKAIGLDKRIGPLFLNAGLGYGGSCLPKDARALIAFSKELGYDLSLIKAVEDINNTQPFRAVELAEKHVGNLQGKRIAILGLAFKPNTDDMREAVSIRIIKKLLEKKANIIVYDPAATNNAKKIFKHRIEYASSLIECIRGADCCIIITEWDEFKKLKPEDFINHMKNAVIIDGRRIYSPSEFKDKVKFAAIGLGQRQEN